MTSTKNDEEIRKALLVMVTTRETRAWLASHDPKALRQAEGALHDAPELEAFFASEREKAGEKTPKLCPFCGKNKLYVDVAPEGWATYSVEDPGNKAILDEHQCAGECGGTSFWT